MIGLLFQVLFQVMALAVSLAMLLGQCLGYLAKLIVGWALTWWSNRNAKSQSTGGQRWPPVTLLPLRQLPPWKRD